MQGRITLTWKTMVTPNIGQKCFDYSSSKNTADLKDNESSRLSHQWLTIIKKVWDLT